MRRSGRLPLGDLGFTFRHGKNKDLISFCVTRTMRQRYPCTICLHSALERKVCQYWCEKDRKHICVTDRHDMTLAVKPQYSLCLHSRGYLGYSGPSFGAIRLLIRLYSALYSDGDPDEFWELFVAFWADSALFVLFGSIWLDDSIVSPHTIRITPNLPSTSRMPPRIRPNSIRICPEYGPNDICRGHIRELFF